MMCKPDMQNEIEEIKAQNSSEQIKIAAMVTKINNPSSSPDEIPEDSNAGQEVGDGYTEG